MNCLFINHSAEKCGVYQFGKILGNALIKNGTHIWKYTEVSNTSEYENVINYLSPQAVIYNYFSAITMPWVSVDLIKRFSNLVHIGIAHEEPHLGWQAQVFNASIIPDPTYNTQNPRVFKTGRCIPDYIPTPPPTELTIGSFGFGMGYGKYTRVMKMVQRDFDTAHIRLHIPYAQFGDTDGGYANYAEKSCREMITKPGITLTVTHNFLSHEGLLDWISRNSLNCFFYDLNPGRGIASTVDYGLAVQRPIAVVRSYMLRHIYDAEPSICAEDTNLQTIINNGIKPLTPFFRWTEKNIAEEYEKIIEKVIG